LKRKSNLRVAELAKTFSLGFKLTEDGILDTFLNREDIEKIVKSPVTPVFNTPPSFPAGIIKIVFSRVDDIWARMV
jgi:hypothetical protein